MLFMLFVCLPRFVQYNPTSLERSYKYDLLTEHDLGVMIDLINPDAYAVNSLGKLINKMSDFPDFMFGNVIYLLVF